MSGRYSPLDAQSWLLLVGNRSLSQVSQFLVEQINRAVESHHNKRAAALIQKLLNNRSQLPLLEQAECTLECGLACYRMGDLMQAAKFLEESLPLFDGNEHYVAVALWMLGGVLWELPDPPDRAVATWSQCKSLFEKLQRRSGQKTQRDWYLEKAALVRQALEDMLSRETPPPPGKPPKQPSGSPDEKQEPAAANSLLLQLFRVVDRVPAGGFGPVGYGPYTIGDILVDRVIINNETYRLVNLKDQARQLRLPPNRYVVVKVYGDSMNKPGKLLPEAIDDGDYVLLVEQDTADDSDIVAAEIQEEDSSYATLKVLRVVTPGKEYILEPHSLNPDHQPFYFSAWNEGFHIRGVVLIVFKRLKD